MSSIGYQLYIRRGTKDTRVVIRWTIQAKVDARSRREGKDGEEKAVKRATTRSIYMGKVVPGLYTIRSRLMRSHQFRPSFPIRAREILRFVEKRITKRRTV